MHPLRDPHPDDPSRIPLAERAPEPMDHSVGGAKPCQYSADTARIVLARLEAGRTVRQIAADPDMPSYRTLYDWRARHEDFAAAWDEVRSDQACSRRQKVAQREPWRATLARVRAQEAGRPAPAKTGRKSTYTPKAGRALCALIATGLSTRATCARLGGHPSPQMVYRWLRNHPDFREAYEVAVEARDGRLADEVEMLADTVTPANLKRLDRRIRRLKAKIAAVRPDVWRWD